MASGELIYFAIAPGIYFELSGAHENWRFVESPGCYIDGLLLPAPSRSLAALAALVLPALVSPAQAAVPLDYNYPWNAGVAAEMRSQTVEPLITQVWKTTASMDNQAVSGTANETFHHMRFAGADYYLLPFSSLNYEQSMARYQARQQGKNPDAVKLLPGGQQCGLYLFDTQLNLVGWTLLAIKGRGGNTVCGYTTEVRAAPAGDGIVVHAMYTWMPAKAVGDNYRDIAFYVRLKKSGSKVDLIQDDACLGNPNTFDSATAAVTELKHCQTSSGYPG
jgi:hypothetical protein